MKFLAPFVALAIGTLATHAGPGFSMVNSNDEFILVSHASRPLVKLMIKNDRSTKEAAHETYKVYLHVIDPLDKSKTITKGAGDKFTHHRGIYIGWSKLKTGGKSYDTWHMKGNVMQVYRDLVSKDLRTDRATFSVSIDWVDGDEVLLSEVRTFIVHKPEANGAFILDKKSRITAVKADAELNGDPEHAGCQFRASAEVVKNKSARYFFPGGEMTQKEVQASRDMDWAAMTFKANGNDYHVHHMSHPSLPTGLRYSAYRDYGRFGSFWVATIKKGKSKTFPIRFHISPGAFPDSIAKDCEARYEAFAK